VTSAVVERGIERCGGLLYRAVETVEASCGALFMVDAEGAISVLAHTNDAHGDLLALMEQAAARTAEANRPVRMEYPSSTATGRAGSIRVCLGTPVFVDSEMVGALVVTDPASPGMSAGVVMDRVTSVLALLGLSVERLRMIDALEQRESEIGTLRQQLDVYAMDFRSTYRAERDRSQELSSALAELEKTYRATVRGLAIAVEAKDECTGGHLQRVTRYGMMLTELVAPEHTGDPQFEYGFLLHDVGKLTVPDAVLRKPGALCDEEWELIRAHPISGFSILDGIPFLAGAREIVYCHHERWDGTGYPQGLAGDQIPLGAQIFPLCDAFDAMTSDRPYRKALSIEDALAEVRHGAGSQFWPTAVEAFLSIPVATLESVLAESHGGLQ
jgi:ribonuclease P protein subunit RPR2